MSITLLILSCHQCLFKLSLCKIDRVFDVSNGAVLELRNLSVVGGLTADNGESSGAGIRVGANSRLVLDNVTISANRATKITGGVYLSGQNISLKHVTITANSANQAGGI